jgi:hypothetical protein
MDERRFDELTRALVAATPSRRETLRRLTGGALAAIFGGLALDQASAGQVGTEAYDSTCEGQSTICFGGSNAGACGLSGTDCVCAKSKERDKGRRCVEQVANCRQARTCKRDRNCRKGEVCIRMKGCTGCPNGVCAEKCPK